MCQDRLKKLVLSFKKLMTCYHHATTRGCIFRQMKEACGSDEEAYKRMPWIQWTEYQDRQELQEERPEKHIRISLAQAAFIHPCHGFNARCSRLWIDLLSITKIPQIRINTAPALQKKNAIQNAINATRQTRIPTIRVTASQVYP